MSRAPQLTGSHKTASVPFALDGPVEEALAQSDVRECHGVRTTRPATHVAAGDATEGHRRGGKRLTTSGPKFLRVQTSDFTPET